MLTVSKEVSKEESPVSSPSEDNIGFSVGSSK